MSTALLLDIAGLLEYLKYHVAMSDITGDQGPELRDPDEEVAAMYQRVLAALQEKREPAPTALNYMTGYSDGKQWAMEQAQLETVSDPCPGCAKGGVCRTPTCGRLKLPVDHPLRAAAKGGV